MDPARRSRAWVHRTPEPSLGGIRQRRRRGGEEEAMGVLVGFIFGYWLGTKAGRKGLDEAINAAREIARSDEVRMMAAGAIALAGNLASAGAGQAAGILGDRAAAFGGDERARIRAV